MSKLNVLIVEDNQDMRRIMDDYFEKQDDISLLPMAVNGYEAIKIMQEKTPDVVLMDIIMPQMDGFSLLDEMNRMYPSGMPPVIILTALNRDDFITRAMLRGACYFMIKPFDLTLVHQRILEVSGAAGLSQVEMPVKRVEAQPTQTMDERIAGMFLSIGIPAHIKGYHFLREAVKLVVENSDVINRITKELYPGIARRFGTTASKVERAIRHAIEVAWNRGRIETINQVFGCNACTLEEKPTNGEFIAMIADKLSFERTA